jgi:hypothetical protein
MTVAELRSMGHDVRDIRGTRLEGLDDAELWNMANTEQRLLITTDKGFSQHRDERHPGVLMVHLKKPNRDMIHRRVLHAINTVDEQDWPGLTMLMRDTVQSRWRAD